MFLLLSIAMASEPLTFYYDDKVRITDTNSFYYQCEGVVNNYFEATKTYQVQELCDNSDYGTFSASQLTLIKTRIRK